jgi:hypothetical protein
MESTNDRDESRPDENATAADTTPSGAGERAERQLEEGKRRLSETLEGDLNVTLGE